MQNGGWIVWVEIRVLIHRNRMDVRKQLRGSVFQDGHRWGIRAREPGQ